jgi:hypothetical protein
MLRVHYQELQSPNDDGAVRERQERARKKLTCEYLSSLASGQWQLNRAGLYIRNAKWDRPTPWKSCRRRALHGHDAPKTTSVESVSWAVLVQDTQPSPNYKYQFISKQSVQRSSWLCWLDLNPDLVKSSPGLICYRPDRGRPHFYG